MGGFGQTVKEVACVQRHVCCCVIWQSVRLHASLAAFGVSSYTSLTSCPVFSEVCVAVCILVFSIQLLQLNLCSVSLAAH